MRSLNDTNLCLPQLSCRAYGLSSIDAANHEHRRNQQPEFSHWLQAAVMYSLARSCHCTAHNSIRSLMMIVVADSCRLGHSALICAESPAGAT